jgi:hypothetical protein
MIQNTVIWAGQELAQSGPTSISPEMSLNELLGLLRLDSSALGVSVSLSDGQVVVEIAGC